MDYLSESACTFDLIEYRHRNKFRFVKDVLRRLRESTYDRVVLVNVQALLFGVLAWLPRFPSVVYWKLESGRAFENYSLAGALPALEWIVPRTRVAVVVPNDYRKDAQRPTFRRVDVIPNAPLRPYFSTKNNVNRSLRHPPLPMALIMYGNLARDPGGMYVEQWRDFALGSSVFRIDFLGGADSRRKISDNVEELPKIAHCDLLELLLSSRHHYSVIGYRPVGINTKLAAPNRLIESLSCGIPVIVHSGNPYLVDTVKKYDCGFVMDFDSLDSRSLESGLHEWERHVRGAQAAASALSLLSALKGTALEWEADG